MWTVISQLFCVQHFHKMSQRVKPIVLNLLNNDIFCVTNNGQCKFYFIANLMIRTDITSSVMLLGQGLSHYDLIVSCLNLPFAQYNMHLLSPQNVSRLRFSRHIGPYRFVRHLDYKT